MFVHTWSFTVAKVRIGHGSPRSCQNRQEEHRIHSPHAPSCQAELGEIEPKPVVVSRWISRGICSAAPSPSTRRRRGRRRGRRRDAQPRGTEAAASSGEMNSSASSVLYKISSTWAREWSARKWSHRWCHRWCHQWCQGVVSGPWLHQGVRASSAAPCQGRGSARLRGSDRAPRPRVASSSKSPAARARTEANTNLSRTQRGTQFRQSHPTRHSVSSVAPHEALSFVSRTPRGTQFRRSREGHQTAIRAPSYLALEILDAHLELRYLEGELLRAALSARTGARRRTVHLRRRPR